MTFFGAHRTGYQWFLKYKNEFFLIDEFLIF